MKLADEMKTLVKAALSTEDINEHALLEYSKIIKKIESLAKNGHVQYSHDMTDVQVAIGYPKKNEVSERLRKKLKEEGFDIVSDAKAFFLHIYWYY